MSGGARNHVPYNEQTLTKKKTQIKLKQQGKKPLYKLNNYITIHYITFL